MVAVLLLVGQGLEEPSIFASMLDLQQMPAKPQYLLASEVRCSSSIWQDSSSW